MTTKQNIAIGLTVLGLAIGANQALAPRTPEELERQHREQQVQDLSDAQEREDERRRQELGEHVDAENRQKLIPGEPRPPELPRVRLRLPW
jgi:hypothetical protein